MTATEQIVTLGEETETVQNSLCMPATLPAKCCSFSGLSFLSRVLYIKKTNIYIMRHVQFNESPQTSENLCSFVFMNSEQPKVKGGEYLCTCQKLLPYSCDSSLT